MIVTYRKGAAVRLSDLGDVVDSVQDLRNAGLYDGKPSVLLIISKQPGANVIETVDRVKGLLDTVEGLGAERHQDHHRFRPDRHHPRFACVKSSAP